MAWEIFFTKNAFFKTGHFHLRQRLTIKLTHQRGLNQSKYISIEVLSLKSKALNHLQH